MHSASFGLSVVIANWVVTLLERNDDASAEVAGVAAGLTLLLGIVTRPAGGRAYGRAGLLRASFLAGGAGTARSRSARTSASRSPAATVVGLAAGLPFAAAFTGRARLRPDAPGAAIGLVNMAAARDDPRRHAARRALVLAARATGGSASQSSPRSGR